MKPPLRADWDFLAQDFDEHLIWMNVHGSDEDQEWYDDAECDETTFRPWDGTLDSLRSRLLLTAATLTLSNGQSFAGASYAGALGPDPRNFSSAAGATVPVADAQPRLFVGGVAVRFWGGVVGVPIAERRMLFEAVGTEEVFPIKYDARSELLPGAPHGVLLGFYRLLPDTDNLIVETGGVSVDAVQQSGEPSVVSEGDRNDYYTLNKLRILGEREEGLRYFDERISEDPLNPEWWDAQAWVFFERGDAGRALSASKEVIHLAPHDSGSYLYTCQLLFKLKDYEECIIYCDKGIAAFDPGIINAIDYSPLLEFIAARSLYALGRYEDAIERLKPLERGFLWGRNPEPLMTRAGLIKACRENIRSQKQSSRKRTSKKKRSKAE